jgi:hypothetical protein
MGGSNGGSGASLILRYFGAKVQVAEISREEMTAA